MCLCVCVYVQREVDAKIEFGSAAYPAAEDELQRSNFFRDCQALELMECKVRRARACVCVCMCVCVCVRAAPTPTPIRPFTVVQCLKGWCLLVLLFTGGRSGRIATQRTAGRGRGWQTAGQWLERRGE